MKSTITVDARGLSCPQPVMLARAALDEARSGNVTVLADSGTSRDNVVRAAERVGWHLARETTSDEGFQLVLEK